jgi:hypothetical protein
MAAWPGFMQKPDFALSNQDHAEKWGRPSGRSQHTSISHAVAINGEKGLLVIVTGNERTLQNHTAERTLLRAADDGAQRESASNGIWRLSRRDNFRRRDELLPKRTMQNARENKPLAEGSQHFLWRNNHNVTVPTEILAVERKQVPDSMHVHRCYQASVMHLNP